MQETRVRFLGPEDGLEKEMAAHSSILAWRIPWMEPDGLQSMGLQEPDTTQQLNCHHLIRRFPVSMVWKGTVHQGQVPSHPTQLSGSSPGKSKVLLIQPLCQPLKPGSRKSFSVPLHNFLTHCSQAGLEDRPMTSEKCCHQSSQALQFFLL